MEFDPKLTLSYRRWFFSLLLGLIAAGCQSNSPAPTEIPTLAPTASITATPMPEPSPPGTVAPSATFRQVIMPTPSATQQAAPASSPTAIPSLAPICFVAQSGDTILTLLYRGGYNDPSAEPAFRTANNMAPNSNNIVAGQTYCVPRPTPTPSPPGLPLTVAAQNAFLPTAGPQGGFITYTVKEGDTALSIEIATGVALSTICKLNPLPGGLNCAGCDLNAAIFQAKCRPIVVVGQVLKLPGPTPTPTITPTLTGSETATPTPVFEPPSILYPVPGGSITGIVRLEWMPVRGLLQPDERYLVQMSDSASQRSWQHTSDANSLIIPDSELPTDGAPHTFYWQVGVARIAPDGTAILISGWSATFSFTWSR